MFGIDTSEFLVVGVVALVLLGPEDLPRLMRVAGRWAAKARRLSAHLRAGVDEVIRQAEATAADAVPLRTLPATPAQLAAMLLTPDTRSREPGGAKSTVAPLLPGPLARSLAPPRETVVPAAAPAAEAPPVASPDEPPSSARPAEAPAPVAPAMLVTRDTRSREPGGAQSTAVPLRPGALAATFVPSPREDELAPDASSAGQQLHEAGAEGEERRQAVHEVAAVGVGGP